MSGGVGLSSRPMSSEASSSISVVSVPFEVTGDGPTRSLGLVNWRPPGESPSSIAAIPAIADLGRREDDSAELRADLSQTILASAIKCRSHQIRTVIEIAGNWSPQESWGTWRSPYMARSST